MNLSGRLQVILIVTVVVIWCMVIFGCSTLSRQPAKQQSHNTPHTTSAIPVTSVDLNEDGLIDSQERHNITQDHPGVLSTFMCISASVVVICAICAWMSRSRPPRSDDTDDTPTSSTLDGGAWNTTDGELWAEPQELGDDWLDSEQDFQGVMGDHKGKRG